jgi:integrase
MPSDAAVIRYDGKRGTVWRIKYRDADARQIMETLGPSREGWTEKKAEAELRERLVRVERGGYRRPAPLTFAEYEQTWFEEGASRRRWKTSTIAQYRSVRRRLLAFFGPMPLAGIRPRHVAEFVATASKEYSAATVNRDLSVLHSIYVSAKREELVESNPAANAERPKSPRRRWRILEREEVGRVAAAFTDAQARVIFLVLVLCGLRRSELQELRWRDVDLLEGILRVTDSKTEEGIRTIAIPTRLQAELAAHYQRTGFKGADERIFCHPERGTTYDAHSFKEKLDAALAVAEVEGRVRPFHDLRHTAITHDAASGSSAIAVMAKAGHANMATTRTYLHLAGTVFRDEAERLEERLLGALEPVESSTDLG